LRRERELVAFLEIKADLGRVASALERIADALDRAFPPLRPVVESKPAPPENLFQFDPEAEWNKEEEEDRQREVELPSR
jgi:hypothetical protein